MFFIFKKNNNFIKEYKKSLPLDLCEEIIKRFEEDSRKKNGVTTGGYKPEYKKSLDLHISDLENWKDIDVKLYNALQSGIKSYIKEFYNINKKIHDVGYNIKKMKANEGFYHWHCDNGRKENRILTFIWYLNTVKNGGETEFFYQKIKIKPEAGKLLIFPSFWTHLHRGKMPIDSDKYIISGWFYFDK